MAGQSVLTATVWGHGKSALLALAARKLTSDDEECMICRGDLPANVALGPCGHLVCLSCVETMRAKNIFKADKGVKCPFCRGFIDRYEPIDHSANSMPAVQEIIDEANKAAAIASAARMAAAEGPSVNGTGRSSRASGRSPGTTLAGPASLAGVVGQTTWSCRQCSNVSPRFKAECNRCQRLHPDLCSRLSAGKDLLTPDGQHIVACCKEKLHPNLNKALQDAGVLHTGGHQLGGSYAAIIKAFKGTCGDRLLQVVQVLIDPTTFLDVAMDYSGNFALQDMATALAAVRKAMVGQHTSSISAFQAAHHGLDPFGALLQAALPHFSELATSPAMYVLQRLTENAAPGELLDLATACENRVVALMCDKQAVHVVLKIIHSLGELCKSGKDRTCAAGLADTFCAEFLATPDALRQVTLTVLGSKALCEAIAVGLPRYHALRAGSAVVANAAALASSTSGMFVLLSLVGCHTVDGGAEGLLRDMVCSIARQLQGHLVDCCMLEGGCGATLVTLLTQRLAEEQEVGWVEAVIQELIVKGDVLVTKPDTAEVLKTALALNILEPGAADTHLSQLGKLLGEAFNSFAEDVYNRIAANPPRPSPKYFACSELQARLMQSTLESTTDSTGGINGTDSSANIIETQRDMSYLINAPTSPHCEVRPAASSRSSPPSSPLAPPTSNVEFPLVSVLSQPMLLPASLAAATSAFNSLTCDNSRPAVPNDAAGRAIMSLITGGNPSPSTAASLITHHAPSLLPTASGIVPPVSIASHATVGRLQPEGGGTGLVAYPALNRVPAAVEAAAGGSSYAGKTSSSMAMWGAALPSASEMPPAWSAAPATVHAGAYLPPSIAALLTAHGTEGRPGPPQPPVQLQQELKRMQQHSTSGYSQTHTQQQGQVLSPGRLQGQQQQPQQQEQAAYTQWARLQLQPQQHINGLPMHPPPQQNQQQWQKPSRPNSGYPEVLPQGVVGTSSSHEPMAAPACTRPVPSPCAWPTEQCNAPMDTSVEGCAVPPAAAAAAGVPWACRLCTYMHLGHEAAFLTCAICRTVQLAAAE